MMSVVHFQVKVFFVVLIIGLISAVGFGGTVEKSFGQTIDPLFLFEITKGVPPGGQFETPVGITVDHQNRIIISDTGNNRIQVFGILPPITNFLFQFNISPTLLQISEGN